MADDKVELTQEETHAKFESSGSTEKKGEEKPKESFTPLSLDQQRQDIYAAYKPEQSSTSEKVDAQETKESMPENKEDSTDSSTDKTEDKKDGEQTKEPKMVPYNALHEERERRKQANKTIKEYDVRLKELEDKLSQKDTSLPAVKEDQDDYSDREKELIAKLQVTQKQLKKQNVDDTKEQARQAGLEADKVINQLDKRLAEEGYPGLQLGRFALNQRLFDMYTANEITKEEGNDPKVWEKVWKEEVYSKVASTFVKSNKEDIMNDKTKKKKALKSPSNPGKSPESAKPKDEKAKSIDELNTEYFNKRTAQSQKIGN